MQADQPNLLKNYKIIYFPGFLAVSFSAMFLTVLQKNTLNYKNSFKKNLGSPYEYKEQQKFPKDSQGTSNDYRDYRGLQETPKGS